jgi:hypothetical protein
MSDMDQMMHQQTKATATRSAIYRTDHVATHEAPGVAIDADAAIVLRAAAARYLSIVEHLQKLPWGTYRQLSDMRDTMLLGRDRDAVTDVLELLKLLEVDYV